MWTRRAALIWILLVTRTRVDSPWRHDLDPGSRVHRTQIKDLVPLCPGHHHDLHLGKRALRLRDARLVNESGWIAAAHRQAA